ncbi:MAG: hypothetical protein QW318_07760 [Candidatus Caldarchaeum sp.]
METEAIVQYITQSNAAFAKITSEFGNGESCYIPPTIVERNAICIGDSVTMLVAEIERAEVSARYRALKLLKVNRTEGETFSKAENIVLEYIRNSPCAVSAEDVYKHVGADTGKEYAVARSALNKLAKEGKIAAINIRTFLGTEQMQSATYYAKSFSFAEELLLSEFEDA